MRNFLLMIILILIISPVSFASNDRALKLKEMRSEKRVALIIGNSRYNDSPLKNPANDAKLMARTLKALGFEVISKIDQDYAGMMQAIDYFGDRIKHGGVGLFYYAGHGMQVGGANYLIPVRSGIKSEPEVKYRGINSGLVMAKMEAAGNRMNIMILDACRNNPFARSFRSGGKGLASMEAPSGSFVAYATAPGKVASDGRGNNGLFTESFVKALQTPGLTIEKVFKNTRALVMNKTKSQQVPFTSSSIVGDFYFKLPNGNQPDSLPKIVTPSDGGDFNLDDLENRDKEYAKREAVVREKWDTLLTKMKSAYNQVKGYEQRTRLAPNKQAAWKKFKNAFQSQDNPYTNEDNNMIAYANRRIDELGQKIAMSSLPKGTAIGGKTYTDPVTGMEFVFVKGGCYRMGDTFGDGKADEKPVHKVCVDDFYIGKYEVTNGQYRKYQSDHNSKDYDGNSFNSNRQPAVYVSWNDAKVFATWLSNKTGMKFRLPTEAEWEYAARSGGKSEKYSGSNNVDSVAWYSSNSGNKTHPVGQKRANGLDIYDISGNVWEWVQDVYSKSAYSSHNRNNPIYNGSGSDRVLRGGSWRNSSGGVRAAGRGRDNPSDNTYNDTGFRLVIETK